ncbi:MAG: hypothetical protein IT305_07035 [Chloroflexi bacterium]|nr:hypothetical protein [Chloroflexota bacterium]
MTAAPRLTALPAPAARPDPAAHPRLTLQLPLRTRLRAWLTWAAPPLLIVAVSYVVIGILLLRAYGYNPTGPIRIGTMLPAERFWTTTTIVDRDGIGYDGQWFFYIAHDPLLRASDPEAFLDLPAYRYARILYPALAWAAALGQPGLIAWALLAVNGIAVVLGAAAMLDILRTLGAWRWLALGYAFGPPIVIGFTADLAEPVAFALVVAGLALQLRRRHRAAGLTLSLGVLAREVSLLVPLCFGLHALVRRHLREGLAYLLPLGLPIAWHLTIWGRLGSLPSAQSPSNFGLPLGGAWYRLGLLLGLHPPLYGDAPPTDVNPAEIGIIVVSVAMMGLGLLKLRTRHDVFAWQLAIQAALALCTGPLVWYALGSYGRVLGLLYLFYGLMVLTGPRRAASVVLAPSSESHTRATERPGWTIFRHGASIPSLPSPYRRLQH